MARLPGQTARDDKRVRWAMVALLFCAALLRTYDIDSNSVETDEIHTLEVAGLQVVVHVRLRVPSRGGLLGREVAALRLREVR